jgi:hypothetical protein
MGSPTISLSSSPESVVEGGSVNFVISAQPAPSQPVTVHYSMRGKAKLGSDYTLSGVSGQATILAGQSSATVILHALNDIVHERTQTATMTISRGPGYQLSGRKRKIATTIVISNGP